MEAWEYQALQAVAAMSNQGQDVSSMVAAIPAAAGQPVADWTKVEQIVTDYSRTNQERLLAYYNEVLPQQSADLIAEVTAAAPTAEAFVSQSLPQAQPDIDVGLGAGIGSTPLGIIGTGFGVDPTGGATEVPVYTAGGGGDLLGLIGLIGGLWSGFSEMKELFSGTPAATLSGSESTLDGGNLMASGTDMVNINGGTTVGGVSFGGPGVPEPPASQVSKSWKTKAFSKAAGEYWVYFWKLTDGRIISWNASKRQAKMWRPKKPIVMYKGSITLSQAVRTQQMRDKMWKMVAKKTHPLKLA